MNCHGMRNRNRNRKTSALPATSLINKREKCFPRKYGKKTTTTDSQLKTHPKKISEKYVRPMAGQLAARRRRFLHNMQQFVARPDVYNKINNISPRIQLPSISKSKSNKNCNSNSNLTAEIPKPKPICICRYNLLQICLLSPAGCALNADQSPLVNLLYNHWRVWP